MRRKKREIFAVHIDDNFEPATLFVGTEFWQETMLTSFDRKAGENGVSILAALIREIVAEDEIHSRLLRQLRNEIAPVHARGSAIDFPEVPPDPHLVAKSDQQFVAC